MVSCVVCDTVNILENERTGEQKHKQHPNFNAISSDKRLTRCSWQLIRSMLTAFLGWVFTTKWPRVRLVNTPSHWLLGQSRIAVTRSQTHWSMGPTMNVEVQTPKAELSFPAHLFVQVYNFVLTTYVRIERNRIVHENARQYIETQYTNSTAY